MSTSQVRNYEKVGFLPPAPRTSSGYRVYGDQHVTALRVARLLKKGYGWSQAQAAMQAVHEHDPDRALSVADESHANIHAQRTFITRALAALELARRDTSMVLGLHLRQGRTVSVGEAASALGVNRSAIRYWEARGVLEAIRDAGNRRRYDHTLLRKLELIRLLREINYDFDTITTAVNDLSDTDSRATRRALERRKERVQEASRAAARATRALLAYIETSETRNAPAG
jgi:DNA-binding transcriptional MerR regulator